MYTYAYHTGIKIHQLLGSFTSWNGLNHHDAPWFYRPPRCRTAPACSRGKGGNLAQVWSGHFHCHRPSTRTTWRSWNHQSWNLQQLFCQVWNGLKVSWTRGYLFIEFGLVSAASESITHGMPPVVPVEAWCWSSAVWWLKNVRGGELLPSR